MADLFVRNPHVLGGEPQFWSFSLERRNDGDFLPSIVLFDPNCEDEKSCQQCGGQFRLSGSGSFHIIIALKELWESMEADALHLSLTAQPQERHPPRDYVERLTDEDAYLGMAVLANGDILLKLHPEAVGEDALCIWSAVELIIPATTPYVRSYASLFHLWVAIEKDNREMGAPQGGLFA